MGVRSNMKPMDNPKFNEPIKADYPLPDQYSPSQNTERREKLDEIRAELNRLATTPKNHPVDTSADLQAIRQELGSEVPAAIGQAQEKTDQEARFLVDLENRRKDELAREEKILSFLIESLPETEERIGKKMDPHSEVAVVIPAYSERDFILRPLESLAEQRNVSTDQFEVIVVVNNPDDTPARTPDETDDDYRRKMEQYRKSLMENQETLKLIRLLNDESTDVAVNAEEMEIIKKIRLSGLKVYAIDKASHGKTLPPSEANVGGARNRGVAEACARFYEAGRNGIIAQSDADTKFDEHYIENLIRTFQERPEIVGLTGNSQFEELEGNKELGLILYKYDEALYEYKGLLKKLSMAPEEKKSESDVFFSGANMASRAFETAIVGGVPKISGGEDPAFGKRLETVGKIVRVEDIITMPAFRFSARTAKDSGQGQSNIRFAENLRKHGALMVKNPEISLREREIKVSMEEIFATEKAKQISPQEISEIFSINGKHLLTDSESELLSAKLKEAADPRQLSSDPELAFLKTNFRQALNDSLPELPFDVATAKIIDLFKRDPGVAHKYEINLAKILEKEKIKLEKRAQLLNKIFEVSFRDKPQKPDSKWVFRVLQDNRAELGLDEKALALFAAQKPILKLISEQVKLSENSDEAMQGAKTTFKEFLDMPAEDTVKMCILKIEAMDLATE